MSDHPEASTLKAWVSDTYYRRMAHNGMATGRRYVPHMTDSNMA